jgi:chromosome segregation ATPase
MNMSKGKDVRPLVAAAAALDDELRTLSELAREIQHEPLDSDRSMTRATRSLTLTVEQQARIEQRLRALVEEIEGARLRQQESVDVLVRASRNLEQRAKSRDALLARFAALGESAAHLNSMAVDLASRSKEGVGDPEMLTQLSAMQVEMAAVAAEAEALASAARTDGWPEIERQADGVRQQTLSAKNKLAVAQRAVAARLPT